MDVKFCSIDVLERQIDFSKYTKVFVLIDTNVKKHWPKAAPASATKVYELNAREANKNLSTISKIMSVMATAGCDRKSLLVAIGGGVVTDIGGFAASIYMRGIDWISVPTTLAKADAAVGGKTGVNLADAKNMIGTFHSPQTTLIDIDFLRTLPKRQYNSGLAEIIKMGFILNPELIKLLEQEQPDIERLIKISINTKLKTVEEDPREEGQRKLLNFGHTIGHALELSTGKQLLHGEAISIGMVAEARLAQKEGLCSQELVERLIELLEKFNLPTYYKLANDQKFQQLLKMDKKNQGPDILWSLPTALGSGKYNHIASEENIKAVISYE